MMEVSPGDKPSNFDEEAFKKFQENYDPSKELAKRAAKDAERDKKLQEAQLNALQEGYGVLRTVAETVNHSIEELRNIETQIAHDKEQIRTDVLTLQGELVQTKAWWEEQTDEIRKMMLWMASMGFQVNLDDKVEDD